MLKVWTPKRFDILKETGITPFDCLFGILMLTLSVFLFWVASKQVKEGKIEDKYTFFSSILMGVAILLVVAFSFSMEIHPLN